MILNTPNSFARNILVSSGLLLAFLTQVAFSQIQVTLKTAKRDYVAHEAVEVLLTLTNNAGRPIVLKNEGGMSWLDINVVDQNGLPLSTRRGGTSFKPVTIPTGRSVKQVIRISSIYPLQREGLYRATARVRLPGQGSQSFVSNRVVFSVSGATKFYRQRVGTKSGMTLDYILLKSSAGKYTELYVQLDQAQSGRTLAAFSLGEALFFYPPKAAVSGKSHLHVLYQKTPVLYRHVEVDHLAKVVKSEYVKRGAEGVPRLITFANGQVKVAGGVPFNPEKKAKEITRRKNISDRPSVIYR